MNLTKCKNGHYYDADRYAACPHCYGNAVISMTEESDKNTKTAPSPAVGTKIFLNLCKWFIQTVTFSSLPLIFYILLHWMFQLEEDPVYRYISELCTFTLVISSSVAMELAKKKYRNLAVKEIIFPSHLILLIIFFIIYGAITISFELNIALDPKVIDNIFLFIKLISGIHFLIAVLLQIVGGFYDD